MTVYDLVHSRLGIQNDALVVTDPRAGSKDGLIVFAMNWCHYCRQNEPVFKAAAAENPNHLFFRVEGTTNPKLLEIAQQDFYLKDGKKTSVTGFPTIFYFEKGGRITELYTGSRTVEAYTRFLKGKVRR